MTTGLAVFDRTLQETNEWLRMIEERLQPCDRQDAYVALRAVLHVLRDRLPDYAVTGLSSQMPMLIRGLFLEGWKTDVPPTNIRDPNDFADAVAKRFPPKFPREPQAVLKAVLDVLGSRITEGEARKVIGCLPESLRIYWPEHLVAHN